MFHRVYRPEFSKFGIMASILEQFEESYKLTSHSVTQPSFETIEDDSPIFNRRRVNFYPTDSIQHLCACNDIILISLANNVILRINLRQADVPEEIDLSKYSSTMQLSHLFMSPNGQHALLSLVPKLVQPQTELLYLPRTSTKLKVLPKFRGFKVTAVAWTNASSTSTSGPILVGTANGLLIETEVAESDGLFTGSSADYWKQVFDIGKGARAVITGIKIYNEGDRYHVLVTTGDKFYHFHGVVANPDERPMFQQVFKTYLSRSERCEPVENLSMKSVLDVYTPKDGPKRFGWLIDKGIYYGKVPVGDDDSALLGNSELIPFQDQYIPEDLVLTQFHALVLYPDHVTGISLLTHTVVFEDYFVSPDWSNPDPHERPRRLLREPNKGTVFVYTERAVFSYKITREDRDVWKVFVERGEFDKARDYCHDNQFYLDQVTTRQAEVLFNEKDYELSAYYYSQSVSISFEEVALKFLRAEQSSSLMRFLRLRLESLQKEDRMQRTMLVVWLVELYLSQIGKAPNHSSLQSEFDSFLQLPQVVECVAQNKGTIYDLMAAHGDVHNFIKLSLANYDYERVIRQHIYKGEHSEALEVLKKVESNRKELFYKFSPTLIRHIPSEVVKVLMQQGAQLAPTMLLPALTLTYDNPAAAKDAAQYLQHCVDYLRCQDQSVHNLLLALYVRHQPDRLRLYLAQQGQDAAAVHYDIHFALRLCQEKGLTEACVQLSALLGLWAAAVELALTVNVDLAITTANLHSTDPELMKSLWLKIAEHVVKEKHDIKSAMEFLKKCPLLKIEDILPFFPDFVTIDDFKEAICNSLQEYNQHIQDLKDEMDESTKSAELIAQELSAFKNRHVVVTWSTTCSDCELQLLLRAFYCFPCGHNFHTDCLQELVFPYLNAATIIRLRDLQRQLLTVGGDDISTASSATTARDLVQSSIDTILAAECVLCGDVMVDSIDKPFVLEEGYDRILKEWE